MGIEVCNGVQIIASGRGGRGAKLNRCFTIGRVITSQRMEAIGATGRWRATGDANNSSPGHGNHAAADIVSRQKDSSAWIGDLEVIVSIGNETRIAVVLRSAVEIDAGLCVVEIA